MKNSILKRCLTPVVGAACAVVLVGGVSSCTDDMHELRTGTPSWLGSSIYDELVARGNFQTTLALINSNTLASQGYKETLSRTGSRTVFVANDEAWQRFFEKNAQLPESNPWHNATSVENLTPAQIRLLFKSNIITNAYLIELLSNKEATTDNGTVSEGMYMRRASGVNVLDTVPVVYKKDYFPILPVRKIGGTQIDYWEDVRNSEESILLLNAFENESSSEEDASPMVHFTPAFMSTNAMSDDDVQCLLNNDNVTNSVASINGVPVITQDITCQNGYIHELQEVPEPIKNMAQILGDNSQFSIFARLMNRFSYPYKLSSNDKLVLSYNNTYNPDGQKKDVYVKRYFNDYDNSTYAFTKTSGSHPYTVANTLPFDPGWNRYYLYSAGGAYSYQDNMAVIFAPTDSVMIAYLDPNTGAGRDLFKKFCAIEPYKLTESCPEAWDCLPDDNIMPFLENCMQTSFLSAIPSKVSNVNNTSSQKLGVERADITHSYVGCNGVVYEINKMVTTPDYSSVFAPLLINSNSGMSVLYNFINEDNGTEGAQGYKAYLNNMATGTKLSYIALSDTALSKVVDVCTYKRENTSSAKGPLLYRYYYDTEYTCVCAKPYYYSIDREGNITRGEEITMGTATTIQPNKTNFDPIFTNGTTGWLQSDMYSKMKDLMDNTMVSQLFTYPQKFYKTKGGGPLYVVWNDQQEVVGIEGSWQYNDNHHTIPIASKTDLGDSGNGITYTVDEVPLTTTLSPYTAITDSVAHPNFSKFAELLSGSNYIGTNDGNNHVTLDKAITLLNNYNYTIYVPVNTTIEKLENAHKLPTWQDVAEVESCLENHRGDMEEKDADYLDSAQVKLETVIESFIASHFQDNAVYAYGEDVNGKKYESAYLDTDAGKFAPIEVNYTQSGSLKNPGTFTVTDKRGETCNIILQDGNYNILTRQYYFNASDINKARQINTSSYAVIHAIDGYLLPGSESKVLMNPETYNTIMSLVEHYNNLSE